MNARLVAATAAQDRSRVERDEAAHVDHLRRDPVSRRAVRRPRARAEPSRRARAPCSRRRRARRARVPSGTTVLAVGDLAAGRVDPLRFEEEHRVGIADRGGHQAFHVGRCRRRDDFEPGDGHRPVLHRLGVLRAETQPAAVRRLDHQRERDLPVGHIPRLGDLVGDQIPAHAEEIREHDLGDRAQPGHRRAHRGADDRLLRDRRVPHAIGAEAFRQPDRRLEDAARRGDVFAEQHDGRIAFHLLGDPGRDRITVGQLRHSELPSAQTLVRSSSSEGSGLAFASAVSVSIHAAVSRSIASSSPGAIPCCCRRTR